MLDATPVDASSDAPTVCPELGLVCYDTYLVECLAIGQFPTPLAQCDAGCMTTPQAHCGVIVPTGVVTTADLASDPALSNVVIDTATVVNTTSGSITNVRAAGAGVIDGIGFEVRDGVGVFRFSDLTVNGSMRFVGTNPAAFVSTSNLIVRTILDLTGDCVGTTPGPGGAAGGVPGGAIAGLGSGGPGVASQGGFSGGAGGGNGAEGGPGGESFPDGPRGQMIPGGAAGAAFGDAAISVLHGGGGGNAGGGPMGGIGGGGGGAIQLVAREQMRFEGTSLSYAGVIAAGCGGKHGQFAAAGGGGGGAGGTILIESTAFYADFVYSNFIVTGGGGGALADNGDGDGQTGRNGSRGGSPGGGDGGTRELLGRTLAGAQGGGGEAGGGGGGAVGRIRFNIRNTGGSPPTIPGLEDPVTTATQALPLAE